MSQQQTMYNVLVTGEQLQAIRDLFDQRYWTLHSTRTDEVPHNTPSPCNPDEPENVAMGQVLPSKRRDEGLSSDDSDEDDRRELQKKTTDEYVALKDFSSGSKQPPRSGSPVRMEERQPFMQPSSLRTSGKRDIDRNKESFKTMQEIGHRYTVTLRRSQKENKVQQMQGGNSTQQSKQQWRISGLNPAEISDVKSNVVLQHHVVKTGNKVKLMATLSTEHVNEISRIPVRIVVLVDRSGSMLNRIGKGGRHAKITSVKHFASKLIASLDDGDEAAIVTFGDEANVFFPLMKITRQSRSELTRMIDKLDKGSMSKKTDLSQGLKMALKVFHDATSSSSDYLKTKNSILVLTDGDVNAGTSDPGNLVHEVRTNIRQMVPSLDESINQWVTISVVTTGTSVSEQAYLLSKTCSSDAYYYVDSDTEDPEAELFLPVLMRKSAVAWNISFVIDAFHGITFVDSECTEDYRIRIRRSRTAIAKSSQNGKAFFLYDLPLGTSRQIGIGADVSCLERIENLHDDAEVFKMRVEYTDIKGERLWQEKSITYSDITASENVTSQAALNAMYIHDMRTESHAILRKAADHVKDGDVRASKAVIMDGQQNIQSLLENIRIKQMEAFSEESVGVTQIADYTRSVVENMGALVDYLESNTTGRAWNKMKAVSTAIARESPNVSDTVMNADVLCPLPSLASKGGDNGSGMNNPLQVLVAKQAARKRVTFGTLNNLLEDMEKTPPK